jgi:hypothetical protein
MLLITNKNFIDAKNDIKMVFLTVLKYLNGKDCFLRGKTNRPNNAYNCGLIACIYLFFFKHPPEKK